MITLLSQLTIIIAGCFSLWLAFRRYYIKSQLDNIPGPPSPSFLQGHFSVFASPTQQAWDFHHDNLEKYGMVVKIKFPLGQNVLQISDPKALYHVLVKDSHVFGVMSSEIERNMLLLGPGLISTIGDHHRKQRNMMNPVFSTVHLRKMMPIFYEVSHKLRTTFEQKVRNGPREIDLLSWTSRTALELISQSGFGLSMDDLSENAIPHTYSTHTKKLSPLITQTLAAQTVIAPWIRKMGPPKMLRFLLDLVPWPAIQELKEVVDVLHNTCVEIFEAKKTALEQSGEAGQDLEHRKDILSILMKENMNASTEDALPDAEVIAQMNTLALAATDTTTSALSRILWLMASNKDVQDKLREEVRAARKEHGDLDHDKLTALPYLEAVCRETLRYYPPVPLTVRAACQDTVLPLSKTIKGVDGSEIHEMPIPNGTTVLVDIQGANRSKEIWGPDADEWKPERWMQPLPPSVTNARVPGVYANMMTFSGGGKACIGFKFSQLEMKVVLSLLIDQFEFSLPKGKEIFWKMLSIGSPTVIDDLPHRPQLPLMVELAK